jgi:hypothetical protein
MNTENFLEIFTRPNNRRVLISKTSIAAIQDRETHCFIVLKEKWSDGTQITYEAALSYDHISSEIAKFEKKAP